MNWYWSILMVRIRVCESTEPDSSIGPYLSVASAGRPPFSPSNTSAMVEAAKALLTVRPHRAITPPLRSSPAAADFPDPQAAAPTSLLYSNDPRGRKESR
jgi:hypothetical protein